MSEPLLEREGRPLTREEPVGCGLCTGSGRNTTGIVMRVNNRLCPRCGGYGTVPTSVDNPPTLTDSDRDYIARNNEGGP